MTTAQLDTPVVSRRFWSGMTLFVCALLVAPMVASQLGGNYWVRVIDFALLYIMLALGLNIVVGYTGLLDMGFIAFYAVGAYLAALLASPHLLDVFPLLNTGSRTACTPRGW
jgi:branched-chain amino acid transport system permease protein